MREILPASVLARRPVFLADFLPEREIRTALEVYGAVGISSYGWFVA